MMQNYTLPGYRKRPRTVYFDTANANKWCVRVHGGQSSEFPIYPTTLERTINTSVHDNVHSYAYMLLFKFVNPTNGACKTKSKRITEKSNSQSISMEKSISLFRLKMIVDNVAVTLVYALWHITMCAVYVSQYTTSRITRLRSGSLHWIIIISISAFYF